MRHSAPTSAARRLTLGAVRAPVVLLIALACQDGSVNSVELAGPPAQLTIVSGNNQEAQVGTELPAPLVVQVRDAKDKPVSGQIVNFRVMSGGGDVFAGAAITNRNGEARERWTLGTSTSVEHRVEARAVDSETGDALVFAVFNATALHAPATSLAFAVQPGSVLAGSPITPAVEVNLIDTYGNVATTSASAVTISLTPGFGTAGAILGGTTTRIPANGIASFNDLTVDRAGTSYTLTATSPGIVSMASNAFTVTSPVAVARVAVTPISFGIMLGDTVTLTATAFDATDNPLPGLVTSWIFPSTVSISQSGLLTGLAAGGGPLKATIGGVTGPAGGAGVTVYATLDSVTFVRTSNGQDFGWTQTTQAVGQARCVRLFSFGPGGMTNPLRWQPTVSDNTVMSIEPATDLPNTHCFRPLRSGEVTVTGSFGGKSAEKRLTIP